MVIGNSTGWTWCYPSSIWGRPTTLSYGDGSGVSRQVDVLFVPLVILALTYALSMSGQTMLLTSIAMYAAVWHRGRQSLGVARFYQRGMGGPVSRAHALFVPWSHLSADVGGDARLHSSGPGGLRRETLFRLSCGAEITAIAGLAAAVWVIAYLAWTLWRNRGERVISASQKVGLVHPGEWWVVLAHAVAFGSGYALGASNASFLLVLAVHHEVQYLYFTYAMARHSTGSHAVSKAGIDAASEGSAMRKLRTSTGRRCEPRRDMPLLFLSGLLSVLREQSSAVGSNSNGWPRWAWADSSVTTGSMVGSGRDALQA